VADRSAFAQFPRQTSQDMPIPHDYTAVCVEKIWQPDFEELELEIPRGDGENTLKDVLHGIILWSKRYIVIIPRISERPLGAGAVIVTTCSRASTIISGAVIVSTYSRASTIVSGAIIVTTCSLTFSAKTIRQFERSELQRSRWWNPSQFTSATIGRRATKVMGAIFQVGATTKRKNKND
jgi:hypothetical protein